MASIASPFSLGSTSLHSSKNFEVSLYSSVQIVSYPWDYKSFRKIVLRKKWRCVGVCRLSLVTADYSTEQGTSNSLDSTYKENETDVVLNTSPKPLLNPDHKGGFPCNLNLANLAFDDKELSAGVYNKEENGKVIEPLGKVSDKKEKLETSERRSAPSRINIRPKISIPDRKSRNSQNYKSGQKPISSRSVWKKGDPLASVQNTVKQSPKIENDKIPGIVLKGIDKVKTQPKLYANPSVSPPPSIKKPVVLKDVGASPKTSNADESKERKTKLVDNYASKKLAVDHSVADYILVPPRKPSRASRGNFKKDFRKDFRKDFQKKIGPSNEIKRRLADDRENANEDNEFELDASIPGIRIGKKWNKASRKAARREAARDAAPVKAEILEVGEKGMSTEELAFNLATSEGDILGYLFSKGIKPDGVQTIDRDMVKMICKEYEVEVLDGVSSRMEDMAKKMEFLDEEDLDSLEERPPVLTIMGHVDHGKTTLLDHIRKSKVAASEAGGITQAIGAYRLLVPIDGKSQPCVFIDTPGHEAFGAIRARGARVTDIAIIVVAADDGIRPQTNEAIAHAKAAGVPIVIAINKIDKDGANPDRVMQELASIGLMADDWGGATPMVKISALKGENVDELLEIVMLVAELQELKANPNRTAKGTVIEAGLHKSKGPIATFIVQNGTLKRGDIVVCGEAYGKVRALFDDSGNRVDEAGPSIPVQVMGLNGVPLAGDKFEIVGSLNIAREKAEARAQSLRNERIAAKAGDGKVTLSSYASAARSGDQGLDLHQLNIILKVDVQGSVEAVRQALQVLPQNNVTLKFLLQATGDVSMSDVDLALASKGIILGFNVKTSGSVKSHADNKGVEIRLYKIIYDLIDDVRNAMEGLLDIVEEQVPIGAAEVRAIFKSGSNQVAGCMVTEGKVVKECGIKVVRQRKMVHRGILNSLKRVKEVVNEVNAGLECGIGIENFDDFEVGDILETFNVKQKKRTLEEASATMKAAVEGTGLGFES